MGMILAVPAVPSVVGWMSPSQSSQMGSRDFSGIPIPLFLDLSEIITRKPTNLGSAEGGGDIVTCHLNARVKSMSPQRLRRLSTDHRVSSDAQSHGAHWAKVMPFLGGHIQGPICVLVI